ncbi:MAG: DHH family phosphoesterase [archaeon]|jgi:RecJ-like exonuclease
MQHLEAIGERKEEAFFNAIRKMASEIKKRDDFVVVFHHDADGCASGAIAVKALEREGKKVTNICLKQLYKENIPQIRELGKNYLFVDFGSGQLDYLVEEFKEDFFVLDHHQPVVVDGKIVEHKWHINPLLFGINGGTELSGSGVTFLFAQELNKNNFDLSVLGVVGALGDMQDFNVNSVLVGMNQKILEVGIKNKLIEVKKDLKLYGRISRPLVSFLLFSSSPVLPGLTAQEDNCKAFLAQLDLPLKDPFTEKWISYIDLSEENKRKLTSALIMLMAENNVAEWKIKELVGDVYTFTKEDPHSPLSDGKEFATLLNACGRNKRSDIALTVCMGDRKDGYYEALNLMDQHRDNLRRGIQFIQEHGIEERKSFYFFDAGETIDESIVGIIAGMLYGSIIQENKPIIALAKNKDGTLKASGRGTSTLVRKGLNIGGALKEISSIIPGVEGGGHRIAAGAKIPSDKINEFLKLLEEKFSEQIKFD